MLAQFAFWRQVCWPGSSYIDWDENKAGIVLCCIQISFSVSQFSMYLSRECLFSQEILYIVQKLST